MDDRKYRQAGYRGNARDSQERRPSSRPAPVPATVRSRAISRCSECGAVLPITADSLTQCPNCGAALHSCQQCAHFDPGQRFECTEPILERVSDKRTRNECASFALRVTVEREASAGSMRPDDARRAFGHLFKK